MMKFFCFLHSVLHLILPAVVSSIVNFFFFFFELHQRRYLISITGSLWSPSPAVLISINWYSFNLHHFCSSIISFLKCLKGIKTRIGITGDLSRESSRLRHGHFRSETGGSIRILRFNATRFISSLTWSPLSWKLH